MCDASSMLDTALWCIGFFTVSRWVGTLLGNCWVIWVRRQRGAA